MSAQTAELKHKPPTYEEGAAVVLESQDQALSQAEAAAQNQSDPRSGALWAAAVAEMEKAVTQLKQATNSPAQLAEALVAERAAYQALLKLQQHEYQVTRNRNRNQRGGGGMDEAQNRQLEQMELAQSENRYETQRQAQRAQAQQRREELQIMSRLQDLARRQQDLNDRLQELQAALQQARSEEEREEIRRRLKRLQEEEQQMLADVDELRQRMDRAENQSRMTDERRQLDQTRENIERAAKASGQGEASQALASGTRAQRQLQQLRDQMRKQNANEFAEDLRQMRAEARALEREQEQVLKQMQGQENQARKSLSDAPQTEQMLSQLAKEKQRMTNLLDHAGEVSRQAEDSEPLLSKQLYDAVRKFSQDSAKGVQDAQQELLSRGVANSSLLDQIKDSAEPDGAKLLDAMSELLRQGYRPQAGATGERMRQPIQSLKRGVERAAESVLGDDTEALRLAQKELEDLTSQLQREMAQAGTNNGTGKPTEQAATGSQSSHQPANPQPDAEQSAAVQRPDRGQPPGQQQQENAAEPKSQTGQSAQANGGPRGGQRDANPGGQNDSGGEWLSNFKRGLLDENVWRGGPLTGDDYGAWSEHLREVEELVELPELRNQLTTARERARLMRQEFKRDQKKPDWAVVRLQVMQPLLDIRERLTEELARRESADALVPIDRDPVPSRYSDLVRKYYEELGKAR